MAATEVIFLRVKPEIKAMLEAHVKGANGSREMGEPEYTLTSFIGACIMQTLAPAQKESPLPRNRKIPGRPRRGRKVSK